MRIRTVLIRRLVGGHFSLAKGPDTASRTRLRFGERKSTLIETGEYIA